jgi:hypothetical protein
VAYRSGVIRLRILTTLVVVVAVGAAAFGIYDTEHFRHELNHLAGQERKTFNELGRALSPKTRPTNPHPRRRITSQDVQKAKQAFALPSCRLHGTTLHELEREAATPLGIQC